MSYEDRLIAAREKRELEQETTLRQERQVKALEDIAEALSQIVVVLEQIAMKGVLK